MPSNRRLKFAILIVVLVILTIIYISTGRESTYTSPFYLNTVQALELERANSGPDLHTRHSADDLSSDPVLDESNNVRFRGQKQRPQLDRIDTDETLRERLREAEILAKKSADEKWRGMQDAADHARGGAAGKNARSGSIITDDSPEGEMAKVLEQNIVHERPSEDMPKPKAQDALAAEEVLPDPLMDPLLNERASAQQPIVDQKANEHKPASHEEPHLAPDAEDAAEEVQPEEHMDEYEQAGTKRGRLSVEDTLKANQDQAAKSENKRPSKRQLRQMAMDPRLHEASGELDRILRLAPMVIFSKSYCPHSKKAKRVLLQAFRILPSPYVVELDQHELGPEIQQLLGVMTGRKTVPNVMVNAKSIGGGDEIEKLWESGKLKSTVMGIAGKRISAFMDNWDVLKNGWKD